MTTFPYLAPWLQCLLRMAPPRGVIHVGAGGSSALPYPFASMPRLLAVEAEAAHHASLQTQLQNHAHCQVVQALVASQPGIANYYSQSQSNENGLCPPQNLCALWPNIKAVRTEQLPATTLQILLDQVPGGTTAFNWVVIDCLPAGEVVCGAGALPDAWDVVVVRALNDIITVSGPATDALSLPALTQQLSVFGLEFVAMEEENHPNVVRALFVRNSVRELEQRNAKLIATYTDLVKASDEISMQRDAEAQAKAEAVQQREEQTKLANGFRADIALLQAQRDRLAQKCSKLTADYADLVKARDELSVQRDAEAQAKTEAIQHRDSLALNNSKLTADYADLVRARDELSVQRDAEAQAKTKAIQQCDSLAQHNSKLTADYAELVRARDKLSAQRDSEAQAKEALTTLQQDTNSKLQRLQQLEAENQNYASRQNLLQEELIKAEAQIELIKDLLLREPGL